MEIQKNLLITGSNGLIGSSIVRYFAQKKKYQIIGIDNNQRKNFFGVSGDITKVKNFLKKKYTCYKHYSFDIRDKIKLEKIFKLNKLQAIIHCAAQPSHDYASQIPFENFDINTTATILLLELTKKYHPNVPFIFLSTNKVYGDKPNFIKLKELKTRWDYNQKIFKNGIDENFSIDQSKHSLFGASKVAADIYVQEYGKYFGMKTCCLRAGCLTGPLQSGVELHGFLNYLIKCNVDKKIYKIYGYKGKQVRDNIDADDVASLINEFIKKPKIGEVYNLGGGKKNSISILEAIKKIEKISGIKMRYRYITKARIGDHICYYSNLNKIKKHFPKWKVKKNLDQIFLEIFNHWNNR